MGADCLKSPPIYQGHIYVYTIFAAPEAPWTTSVGRYVPWTEVLDYSCDWAEGESDEEEIIEEIVEHIYEDIGLVYDTKKGDSQYTNGPKTEEFRLTRFLDEMPNVDKFACYDGGKALKTFANVLGCELDYVFSNPVLGTCFGYLNCVKPAGKEWTNNPFYDSFDPFPTFPDRPNLTSPEPIVDGDCSQYQYYIGWPYYILMTVTRSSFSNHALCALGNYYYDATMTVDIDGDPDGPPHNEEWIFGLSWSTYEDWVVDNIPSLDCEDREAISYEFSIE